ncbi:MarR family winged helix-turn-helix transcriptional regulator [Nonomuraea fastidiosa]|jgi:DNA-binding MarR family transcriptional regulator|uniref:MarR family winged helix-turn-helix transcriptional regulator n=1 Tax=Nonomuraea TaxID=83681 RepID=UPI00325227EE
MSDEPVANHTFGWTLGVLLRAYQSTVVTVIGDLPHGQRGYQTLAAVVSGRHPTQLALASYLGIDRTVLTYLVDDLVEAGLVERRLNPNDRRQRRIVATDKGERVYKELERRVSEAEDHLLGALSPDERTAFKDMLQRTACAVSDIEPAKDPCQVAEEMLSDGG